MSSYLGNYNGASSKREFKLHRAIQSYLNQKYPINFCSELIISSDGCGVTNQIFYDYYNHIPGLKLLKNERFGNFKGSIRQNAINIAQGKIICFLDTDDIIGDIHLYQIVSQIGSMSWCYWDDYIYTSEGIIKRNTDLVYGKCGTSTIAYKKDLDVTWNGYNGYGHDYEFISQELKKISYINNKIKGPCYICCHIPGIIDK